MSESNPAGGLMAADSTDPTGHRSFHLSISRLRARIQTFGKLEADWDSHGANPIGRECRELAMRVLDAAQTEGVLPAEVAPTPDESVMFMFRAGARRLYVEVFGDGEIAVLEEHGSTKRAKIADLPEVARDISELHAGTSRL